MIDLETYNKIQQDTRSVHEKVTVYGKYTEKQLDATYSDYSKKYEVQKVQDDEELYCHSSKSFIEFIKSELKRRSNKTGEMSTLIIGLEGGKFVADDNFNEGVCNYKRILSQQWKELANLNGKILNHEEFLMSLLKLSPSCSDFKTVYSSFLKVRIVGNSEMVSNPVFVNNQAESGYLVKYKLQGGQNADDVIPDKFTVEVPFIKASQKKYQIDVDVQVLNDSSNNLRIKVNIPLIENIEETAIIDEINDIKEHLSDYCDMLVMSDI